MPYLDQGRELLQSFEVQLNADSCWKADASPVTQPAVLIDARTGLMPTNPLAEFDGCLDGSWT